MTKFKDIIIRKQTKLLKLKEAKILLEQRFNEGNCDFEYVPEQRFFYEEQIETLCAELSYFEHL